MLGLCTALVIVWAGVGAGAAEAAEVTILSPREGKRVDVGQRFGVRVRAKGARFRFYVDGRDVTRRFDRKGPIRAARLRAGSGLRGDIDLMARVGPRHDSAVDIGTIIAMKRDDDSARFMSRVRESHRIAPLVRARTDRPLWKPRVWLNGERIDRRLEWHSDEKGLGGRRSERGRLGAHMGLRFGRNRVVTELLQQSGKYARHVRSFRIPRDRPIAGAGPDRATGVGEAVVLDGSSTLVPGGAKQSGAGGDRARRGDARGDPPVRYRWEVVKAPGQAEPVLLNPSSPTPTLALDQAGDYVLRLSTSLAGGPETFDEVGVSATRSDGALGMPIQTITGSGSIRVDDKDYESPGGWVRMLVLDANRLTKVSDQTFKPGQLSELKTAAGKQGPNIVILTGQGKQAGQPIDGNAMAGALEAIGGTVSPPETVGLRDGRWSVIGHSGLPEGYADQNFGATQAPVPHGADLVPGFPTDSGTPGSLNGFMQLGGSRATYQYVSSEYAELDTKWTPDLSIPPDPTRNTIQVGDELYPSSTIQEGEIAIQMLVLDPELHLIPNQNQTHRIMKADGSTDFQGIYFLDQALDQWVKKSPSQSNLVILQDFGHQECQCWPGGSSVDWVQDHLPPMDSRWQGNPKKFPHGRLGLIYSWNRDNSHGFGSVAGNIAQLAGTAAHDVVANYRRPLYVDNDKDATKPGKVISRDYGGLTVVASTNLDQPSDGFYQGQGPPALSDRGRFLANGRVTGILRRNEQSQWHLTSSALGPGWNYQPPGSNTSQESLFNAKALWDLIFARKPVPWPCTAETPSPCPDLPDAQGDGCCPAGELPAALQHFAMVISRKSGKTSPRDFYPDQYGNIPGDTLREDSYPGRDGQHYCLPKQPQACFGEQTYDALKQQLEYEITRVNVVGTGIQSWQGLFTRELKDGTGVIQAVAGKVIADVQAVQSKLQEEKASVNGASIASDVLRSLSAVVTVGITVSNPELAPVAGVGGAALGGLSALVSLGNDSYQVNQQANARNAPKYPPNDVGTIRNEISKLATNLADRYDTIEDQMGKLGSIFVDDWGKLQVAFGQFAPDGPWSIPNEGTSAIRTRAQQAQSIAEGIAVYESVLPIALRQWIVSPHRTNWNHGAARDLPKLDYRCQDLHGDRGDQRNPYESGKTSTYAIQSQAWYGGFPYNMQNYTIRVLKYADDNMAAGRYKKGDRYTGDGRPISTDHNIGLAHSGTSASSKLLEPLLGPPDPDGNGNPGETGPFGVTKEELFGLEAWDIAMLQCGDPTGKYFD